MAVDLPLVGPLERTLHLRSLSMFDGIRSRALAVIAQLMREEYVPRGGVLGEERLPPQKLSLLVEGRVRSEHAGRVIDVQEAPAVVGVNGILGGARASLRTVAETRLTVLSIDAQAFLDVLEDYFPVFLHFRRLYAERVVALQRQLGAFLTPLPSSPLDLPPSDQPLGVVEQILCMRRTAVFEGLAINLLAQLIRGEPELRRGANETLWREGGPGDALLVIVRGHVRCTANDPRAEFHAGPSAVLGAYAAFGGVPYSYDAVTETPIVALRVATTTLTDIIEDHFELGLRALSRFAQEEVRLMELQASRAGGGHSGPSARQWSRRDTAAPLG